MNWRLTLLALILVPVSAVTAEAPGRIMKRAVRRSLESMSNIYKILQETFQGIVVVKAYTMERRERRRFFLETKSLYKKSVRVAKIDALSDPVLEMLALSTVSIALLAGSYLVLNKTIFLDLGLAQAATGRAGRWRSRTCSTSTRCSRGSPTRSASWPTSTRGSSAPRRRPTGSAP